MEKLSPASDAVYLGLIIPPLRRAAGPGSHSVDGTSCPAAGGSVEGVDVTSCPASLKRQQRWQIGSQRTPSVTNFPRGALRCSTLPHTLMYFMAASSLRSSLSLALPRSRPSLAAALITCRGEEGG